MTSPLRDITGATVADVIHGRRSIRQYTGEPVPEECVHSLLRAAVCAPTAMHEEPWGFVVIQDRARLKRYSDEAKSMLRAMAQEPRFAMLADPAFNIFYDAGTLIVVCSTMPGRFVEADCWLAAGNVMLSAHAHGYGTCCIGFAVDVLNRPDVKAELGIPAGGAAIAPIIVGTPRGSAERVPRKSPRILAWLGGPIESSRKRHSTREVS